MTPVKNKKKYLPFANRVDSDHFPVSHKLQCLLMRSSYIGVKLISLSVGV